MIKAMDVVHMTEAEVVKDIAAVLAKVRQGSEIVIEEGSRPMAVIKRSVRAGRMITDVITDLKARGSDVAMDDEFARDIEEGIKAHRQPWNPPLRPGTSSRLQPANRSGASQDEARSSHRNGATNRR